MADDRRDELRTTARMAGWTGWLIDASGEAPLGMFCFIPYTGDLHDGSFAVVDGLDYVGLVAPGPVHGIVHPDGQAAVDAWEQAQRPYLDALELRMMAMEMREHDSELSGDDEETTPA